MLTILRNRLMGGQKKPIAQTRNGVIWLHIDSRKGFKKKPLNVLNNYKIISHIKFQPIRLPFIFPQAIRDAVLSA